MRIISILVAFVVLWVMLVPQIAAAAEIADANETQIKFKIKDNIELINGFIQKTAYSPYVYEGYSPIENPEDVEREKKLARFAGNSATVPAGKFTINASAYTAAADECGKSDGITASGAKAKENRTLACPKQYKFGTKIKIEGYGTFVCEDRGGAIKGNHFDIYMQTKKQAFAFGRRNLLAEVVN